MQLKIYIVELVWVKVLKYEFLKKKNPGDPHLGHHPKYELKSHRQGRSNRINWNCSNKFFTSRNSIFIFLSEIKLFNWFHLNVNAPLETEILDRLICSIQIGKQSKDTLIQNLLLQSELLEADDYQKYQKR